MSKWKNFFLENVSTLLPSVQFRFFGKKSKYVISKPYTLTYYQSSHALSKRWISTKQLGPAPIAFFMVIMFPSTILSDCIGVCLLSFYFFNTWIIFMHNIFSSRYIMFPNFITKVFV